MKSADLVTTLSRLAARAEPPPLDDADVHHMISRAARLEPIVHRRSRAWVFAVAAAAVVVAWLLRPSASLEHVLDMRLPTGDHLVGVAGARFDIAELAPAKRRIELHRGTVMFDVAHVVANQRFEVVTDHLTATAKGTVFSVETDALRSRVRVYEGVVEIEQAGRTHTLLAGALWDSSTVTTEIAFAAPAALAPSITAALHERGTVFKVASTVSRGTENRSGLTGTVFNSDGYDSSRTPTATTADATPPNGTPTNGTATTAVATSSPANRTATTAVATSSPANRTATTAVATSSPANRTATTSSAPTSSAPNAITATTDIPVTAPWSTDSVPLAKLSATQLLATARADLETGNFADALDAAKLVTPWSGAWWQIVADAHRGAGDTADAAAAYDHAAKLLTGADRDEAGYSAAYLRFRDLHQYTGALASLDAAAVDAAGSPLEERALGLRAQILVALGRDAKPTARRYLAQFPHADLRGYMLALTK